MIVSWDWLREYVRLDMPLQELTERLTMAGLNLEETAPVGDDTAIDLEVTSNRPDWLGHIGIAREIGVLFDRDLTIPPADVAAAAEKTASVASVSIECPDLCPRYYARVIRGVKIGPSPQWLRQRLETVGIASINNVVDITNYVLMECGQPLHAFDFDKLRGGRIVVRRARDGEKFIAINQREYTLTSQMCVIADAERAVALGGVMGGLETEIGDDTVNVLVEVADFAPLAIRSAARRLSLHSDSSYRFERGIDPWQMDWASRRCCELIVQLAGGELLGEPVLAGQEPARAQTAVPLRFSQISRLLGISIPEGEACKILRSLGLEQQSEPAGGVVEFVPPTWRRDLTREADLIEEVARVHGYDQIPEDAVVPLQLSQKSHADRVSQVVRDTLVAAGFYETITLSFVSEPLFGLFTPRPEQAPLRVEHSSRKHENLLRQSLVPNLMQVRRENERHGTFGAQLFEIARVYLQAQPGDPAAEPLMVALVSGRSFAELKGVIEVLVGRLNHSAQVTARPCQVPQFAEGRGAELAVEGRFLGWIGEVSRETSDRLDLRDAVVAAELSLATLEQIARLVPAFEELPRFPAVSRDLNFVLDEGVAWDELAGAVRTAAGPFLDEITFGGQYRGKQIPAGKKSYVVTLHYRSPERTLTNEEVEETQHRVVQACAQSVGATLRS